MPVSRDRVIQAVDSAKMVLLGFAEGFPPEFGISGAWENEFTSYRPEVHDLLTLTESSENYWADHCRNKSYLHGAFAVKKSVYKPVTGNWKSASNFGSFIRKLNDDLRLIAELDDDWDEDGSTRFETAHVSRIQNFLQSAASSLWRKYNVLPTAPQINPVSNGTIDIYWRSDVGELLINVPNSTDAASFYGDNFGSKKIKGTTNLTGEDFPLILWLNLTE